MFWFCSLCTCWGSREAAPGRWLYFFIQIKKIGKKKHSHSLFPFFFLVMCNIFPCDGQIFISSLSVQMKSGKQSVLAQSLHSFPVTAVSMSCHKDHWQQQQQPHKPHAVCRPTLRWLQLRQPSIHPRSLPNLKYASQCISLLNSQWNCLWRVPDPKISLQWDIKKYSWNPGLTMKQENETLKSPLKRSRIPCQFSEAAQVFWSCQR